MRITNLNIKSKSKNKYDEKKLEYKRNKYFIHRFRAFLNKRKLIRKDTKTFKEDLIV